MFVSRAWVLAPQQQGVSIGFTRAPGACAGGHKQRQRPAWARTGRFAPEMRYVVARVGIEPTTRGFSVRCSTN